MLRQAVLVAGVAVAVEHASKQPTVRWPRATGAVQVLVVLLDAGLDQPGGLHLPTWMDGFARLKQGAQQTQSLDYNLEQ